jgi:hypothetical protein
VRGTHLNFLKWLFKSHRTEYKSGFKRRPERLLNSLYQNSAISEPILAIELIFKNLVEVKSDVLLEYFITINEGTLLLSGDFNRCF